MAQNLKTAYKKYRQSPKGQRTKRNAHLRRTYGITVEEYDALLLKQLGVCAICSTDTPGHYGRFVVDHCHKTGKIRGLLCQPCNQALGAFRDNISSLKRAIEYLEN